MGIASRRAGNVVRAALACLPTCLIAWLALGGRPLAAQPLRWAPLGPRGGWVQTLAPVPASAGMVWAGVPDLGVWRSVDGGASWVEAGALAVQHGNGGRSRAVVADPVDPLTVYAATAGGLAKSVDGGATWNVLPGTSAVAAFAVAPSAPRVLYQASGPFPAAAILSRSDDGGATWRILSPGLAAIFDLAVDPTDAMTVYVSGSSAEPNATPGLLRSTDGGATWTSLPLDKFASNLVIDPRRPTTLYAVADQVGIVRSRDRGATWEAAMADQLFEAIEVSGIALDAASGALYAALNASSFLIRTGQIWKSVDGATSWTAVLVSDEIMQSVAADAGLAGRVYAGTLGAGILVSADAGDHWQVSNAGMEALGVDDLTVDPHAAGTVYLVQHTINRLARTTDGGASWTLANAPGQRVIADPRTPGLVYAAAYTHLWRSADGGQSWQDLSALPLGLVLDVALDPVHAGVLLAAGIGDAGNDPGVVVRSADRGATWQVVLSVAPRAPLVFTTLGFRSLLFDAASPGVVFAGGEAGVWKSEDGGGAWTQTPGGLPIGQSVTRLSLDDAQNVYAMVEPRGEVGVIAGRTLFRSGFLADTTWEPFDDGIPLGIAVRDLVQDPRLSALYAGTDAGVYVAFRGSTHWGPQNDGLGELRVTRLAADPLRPGVLYAGTVGGVFVSPPPTGVCAPDDAVLCLAGRRFSARVSWRLADGSFGSGHAVGLTGDTGTFWFFGPANTELTVKLLDGTPVNGHFWVFYGGLSDVEYVLEVTDEATGARRTYRNAAGSLASAADTSAFPGGGAGAGAGKSAGAGKPAGGGAGAAASPPAGAQAGGAGAAAAAPAAAVTAVAPVIAVAAAGFPCLPARDTLCLLDSRFAVAITWRLPGIGPTSALAVPLSRDTGAFWFFGPQSLEALVKVVDGRPVNGHFWVFVSGLSDVAFTVSVTDTATGARKDYVNQQGELRSRADTSF